MVNLAVPRSDLEAATLELAQRVAKRPTVGLRLAKMAVNQSLDAQGQWTAIQAAFALHHVGHANARSKCGYPVEPTGAELIRNEAKSRKA